MASYAEVETALARMHGADAEAQKGAFRGRMKHFQRLGLPLGIKPGKGKKIDYGKTSVLQLAIALELAQCGIDPALIVNVLLTYWEYRFEPQIVAMTFGATGKSDQFLVLSVSFMSLSWESDNQTMAGIGFMKWDDQDSSTDRIRVGDLRRTININVSDMIRQLDREMLNQGVNLGFNPKKNSTER